jgi:DNA-binding winged helix-turn-helix (wHTH) protein/tetratricopeptide (TPR) repeat protein
MTTPIDLATEPPFAIGELQIYPSTHEVGRDGQREIVEPRVMQVLVALARADGAVLTRDELIFRCWDGRIVGDDAIHRVLSRLRRLTDGIARDAFRVETITKVGYRLVQPGDNSSGGSVDGKPGSASRIDRRTLVAATGATAALAATGLWVSRRPKADEIPPEAQALLTKGGAAIRVGTPEEGAAAVSQLREATRIAPASAQAWGALALAYQQQATRSGAQANVQLVARARAAADRALALDRNDADAQTAMATLLPFYKRWLAYERDCKRVLVDHPDHWMLNVAYAHFLCHAGRSRAALPHLELANAIDPLSPQLQWMRALSLFTLGRLDEADSVIDDAIKLWPRHYAIWFVRNALYNYTGRPKSSLAMIADVGSRPVGIPDWNFELCLKESRALDTRAARDIEDAMAAHMHAAHQALGFAEIAVSFASMVGRLDDAFAILNAYYFNRGFTIGEQRYSKEQSMFAARSHRYTWTLFAPQTAPLRADRRFAPLLSEIGLESYWREAGVLPDFRSA